MATQGLRVDVRIKKHKNTFVYNSLGNESSLKELSNGMLFI
jgi:hypothetical protein